MSRPTTEARRVSILICAMLAVLAVLLVPASQVGATDYHVDQSGDDSTGDGSLGAPWRTIRYGLTQLSAGDTLYIHAGTYPAGGDSTAVYAVNASGTSGSPIVITNYQDDEVVIATNNSGFYLEDRQYITFDGLEIASRSNNNCIIAYGNHIIVRNCILRNQAIAVKCNRVTRYTNLLVENCVIYSFSDIPLFLDNMDKVILRGNTIYSASSVLMDPGGISNLVIDGNFAYNTGNRLGELKIRWGNNESQAGDNCNGAIVRRNVFCNGERYIALLASANGAMVYNNTLAKIDGEATESGILFMQQDGTDATDDKNENNVIKNNNFYNIGDDTVPETWWYNTFIYMDSSMSEDYGDQEIDYNSYYKAGGTKYIRYGSTWVYKVNVNGWYSGQYDNNSLVGDDPEMVDPTIPAGMSGFDLTSSSPCIDAGTALTTTNGSGSGTTITVHDARYFCDGYSLVDGDEIVVDNQTVTVTSRDISQNTITVDTSVSWSDGDIVTLVFNGDAPDIGAFESDFGTAGNTAPTADAGSNDSITLPNYATLDGTVSDDGLPDPPASVTTTWSKDSGPGNVTFGDASAVDTTAGFSENGVYVLQLLADDGTLTDSDTVQITVNHLAPTADAGSDDECTLPSGVTLDGTISDDGFPTSPGSVTTTWTKSSGPGTVTFGNSAAVDTTAGFSEAGAYILQLEASDGDLSDSDTVAITVNAEAGGTGPFQEEGGTVVMETENYDTSDQRSENNPWSEETSWAGYVGDGYMQAPGGASKTWATGSELTYEIDFSTAGTYYIWARRYADSKNENAALVGLDGTQIGGTFDDEKADYDQWIWKEHGTAVYISATQHTFNLRKEEKNYGVDRIILTDDSGYTPSGNGPAESSRQ